MTIEFTGQCLGGPVECNFVTASVDRFPFKCVSTLWLDGPENPPVTMTVDGTYIWQPNEEIPYFKWELLGHGHSTRNTIE